jgi:hypothetical protein
MSRVLEELISIELLVLGATELAFEFFCFRFSN